MATTADTTPSPDWAQTAEHDLLDQALLLAPGLGWTTQTAILAGRACGFSRGETDLILPNGPQDLAALLSRRHDRRALATLGRLDPTVLKIRDKIARAVEARLDATVQDEAAVRGLTGFLVLPANLALGARLAWETADVLWRWAGDTATDENHYSKRAIFVARRIENVMAFEAWKATTRLRPSAVGAGFAAALGRMRYRRA
jgi:ubiquinone biosynthesis protein COQ9